MNRTHLTEGEAAQLYAHWCENVAGRVRAAAARAHGRRDRHRSDLADLSRDLGAVDLRGLLEPEPEARLGTAVQAVCEADRLLAEAAQQHAWGAHKTAIVYLQQAYIAANHAIELADAKPEVRFEFADGPIPPRPPARERAESEADQPDDPDDPGWHLQIPHQRG